MKRIVAKSLSPAVALSSSNVMDEPSVTKSGTNVLHGSAFGYQRNEKMRAKGFFERQAEGDKPPFSRQQFGGTDLAQRCRAGIVAWIALPAALAACGGDEISFDICRRVLRQGATSTQCLIVGVGEDAQQSVGFRHIAPQLVILIRP